MTLAERLAHAPKGRGHTCSIGILLATMPTQIDEVRALTRALEDGQIAGNEIARILLAEGYVVDAKHIHQHRRGDCTTGNCPLPLAGRKKEV